MGEMSRLEEDEEDELVRVWETARGRLLVKDVANVSLLDVELIMAREKQFVGWFGLRWPLSFVAEGEVSFHPERAP
jgi:hypothetical protein